jgi:hypothetical protein
MFRRFPAILAICVAAACGGGSGGGPAPEQNPPPPPTGPVEAETQFLIVDRDSIVVDENGSATFRVRLSKRPAAALTLTCRVVGGAGGIAVGQEPLFQPDEWHVFQEVVVASQADTDTWNDQARVELFLNGHVDASVDVTQQDSQGSDATLAGTVLTVKDASGAGAVDHPVTAVIPLPHGAFQGTSAFRIVDGTGAVVPAQFEVLNRWWARDNSLRHVVAHFAATVPADGAAVYHFQTAGAGPAPARRVRVTQAGASVTVDTGVLRFVVRRDAFNLFDEVWLDRDGNGSYATDERIVSGGTSDGPVFAGRLAGDVQRARARGDLRLVVEESGPMRAVIRVSGLTDYQDADDHTHGFAVRFFAYAGRSQVKVDYQLQNSAKNAVLSAPLYFEDVSLHVAPDLVDPTLRLTTTPGNTWTGPVDTGRYLFQSSLTDASVHDGATDASLLTGTNPAAEASFGWADVTDSRHGVFVAVRHMAEMWPNGVEVSPGNGIAVRLWPEWSAQFHENELSPSGLYWMEDMQHVVKEVLFWFHDAAVTTADLDDAARNFQYHPIPFVSLRDYDNTRVTLDLDGILPSIEPTGEADTKRLLLGESWIRANRIDPTSPNYNFGWQNFMGDVERKFTAGGGSWPGSAAWAIASQNVDRWLTAESRMWGELNTRGEWLAEYKHADDFDPLYLTTDPYAGRSWRIQLQGNEPLYDSPHITGTDFGGWFARDNPHGWFYNVEEFYYLSANPWIRDWYEFIGEFRKGERSIEWSNWSSLAKDGWASSRAEAHAMANQLQAFRVTGEPGILEALKNRMRTCVEGNRHPQYGIWGGASLSESPFMVGYLSRAMIQMMTEVKGHDLELYNQAFQFTWGIVEWNRNFAQYCYFINTETEAPLSRHSDGTAMILGDPVAWFGRTFGRPDLVAQLNEYIDNGLDGGQPAFGDLTTWTGDYVGRATVHVRAYPVRVQAPAAIGDLTAVAIGTGTGVRLTWTTPEDAVRFHVVWSTLPLVAPWTRSATERNPWLGTPVAQDLAADPEQTQTLDLADLPAGETVYMAIFSLSEQGHLSPMSNVASLTVP